MPGETFPPIPALFPVSLQDACLERVLNLLIAAGKSVEERSRHDLKSEINRNSSNPMSPTYARKTMTFELCRRRKSSLMYDLQDYLEASFLSRLRMKNRTEIFFTRTDHFMKNVLQVREYLVTYMSSQLIDLLSDSARRSGDISQPGHLFLFSVLCNERLQKFVACHHDEEASKDDLVEVGSEEERIPKDWTDFLESDLGSDLFLASLGQMTGLSTLTLHTVCNDDTLYIIADTCSRLQVLDISYSGQVTDLGLIYLCGTLVTPASPTLPRPPKGCKYLKELLFNPDGRKTAHSIIHPKVIACVLRHLSYLEVLDLQNLHQGIEYYFFGSGESTYAPVRENIPPLSLIHYTGTDAKLAKMVLEKICPKLRAFKLVVTSEQSLRHLGASLSASTHSLDSVHLVYDEHHDSLVGLEEFLGLCGSKISSLILDCGPTAEAKLSDFTSVAENCKFLDSLTVERLRIGYFDPDPDLEPLALPFLTYMKLKQIKVERRRGREAFKFLLGGCPDLERLLLVFDDLDYTAFFFNDFLIDDVLNVNPLNRLESLVLKNVSLTLISALRLISQRPKLRSLGSLMTWDVEASELRTFAGILRKANSLKLLQNISIT